MKLCITFVVLLSFLGSAFANHRDSNFNLPPRYISVQQLQNLTSDVNSLTFRNSDQLLDSEMRMLFVLLSKSRSILLRASGDNRICSFDEPSKMRQAFLKMKSLARSNSGFQMRESDSNDFALRWVDSYRCSYADDYVRIVRSLRSLTYAQTGLGMSEVDSIRYTKLMAIRFCGDYGYENEFRQWLSLASSRTGMNLPIEKARDFAKRKMETIHFSCVIE